MEKYGGKRYYRIRVPVFWLLVICVVLLFFGIYFKDELHKKCCTAEEWRMSHSRA